MGKDQQLIKDFKTIFNNHDWQGCYSSNSDSQFDIIEHNNRASMVSHASPSFRIFNLQQKLIHFIAIDHCFLADSGDYKGKRVDCIVFNNLDFCFVELKLNVMSDEGRTRRDRINEAIEQLGSVINYFKTTFLTSSIDFMMLGFRYEAYIVLPPDKYPRDSAAAKNRSVEFAMKYGVGLFEKHEKKFQ